MPEGADNHDDKAAAEAALVEKARAMESTLAMRARDAELNRRISEQTDADFRDAGFYRALQPARYGGIELDYGAQTAFARELGLGCLHGACRKRANFCARLQKDGWRFQQDYYPA